MSDDFPGGIPDPRHLNNGWQIPSEGYCDQPYVVKTDDGAWLCIMTTGTGHEGATGQHVVSTRSTDCGRTWSELVDVEPADGPEASYAVLLKVPSGRVYAFYNHNTDNVRRVKADNPPFGDGYCTRVDSLGHYVFKYSDDHGRSWSEQRFDVPVREMDIDRQNADGGRLRYFWNVGKPFVAHGAAFVSLHKVGGFGDGFFTSNEGVLIRSENILTEEDPAKITWETLPEGERGLRAPAGGDTVASEHSYSVLSDGSFYCVYRTIDGHPACAYSRDGGRTWSDPEYKKFPDGRLFKHPRAANFAWRCANGHYLYWFHNHGGRFIREHPAQRSNAYEDRNPVWLCGGIETDSPEGRVIQWSEPEIVLYDDDPYIRMSYPDLVEEDGQYYLTETQKDVARVHRIDPSLLQGLWDQFERADLTREGQLLEVDEPGPAVVDMPALPPFVRRSGLSPYGTDDLRTGFSLELWFQLDSSVAGRVLLDTRLENGQGFVLQHKGNGQLELVLDDGRTRASWDSDPRAVSVGKRHHAVVIVDGGPNVISFVVDGRLCDGGDFRQFGWGRFSPHLRHANGSPRLLIDGAIDLLRVYGRALRTSETISNFRSGDGV
ncbi:MAG: LamG-like jellyroll fold domain-containing protein [Candidatus Latescibacterota bacterium]